MKKLKVKPRTVDLDWQSFAERIGHYNFSVIPLEGEDEGKCQSCDEPEKPAANQICVLLMDFLGEERVALHCFFCERHTREFYYQMQGKGESEIK